jgi:hypothetical protein
MIDFSGFAQRCSASPSPAAMDPEDSAHSFHAELATNRRVMVLEEQPALCT